MSLTCNNCKKQCTGYYETPLNILFCIDCCRIEKQCTKCHNFRWLAYFGKRNRALCNGCNPYTKKSLNKQNIFLKQSSVCQQCGVQYKNKYFTRYKKPHYNTYISNTCKKCAYLLDINYDVVTNYKLNKKVYFYIDNGEISCDKTHEKHNQSVMSILNRMK